jgi:hypothetical protein
MAWRCTVRSFNRIEIQEFKIKALKLIIPKQFSKAPGYFQEKRSDRVYCDAPGEMDFVQDS